MVMEGYSGITLDEDTFKQIEKIKKEGKLKTIPETIRALVQNWKLEDKSEIDYKLKLFLRLVDYEQSPFTYFILEQNITQEEEKAIYDLMEKTTRRISNGGDVSHIEFENEIYKILPRFKGDYHLVESIVKTLNDEQRWKEVYLHMQKNGMNLPKKMPELSSNLRCINEKEFINLEMTEKEMGVLYDAISARKYAMKEAVKEKGGSKGYAEYITIIDDIEKRIEMKMLIFDSKHKKRN